MVAAADASQIGVAYFQGTYTPTGGLLYLVDALIAPPGAATLQAVHARFNELFEQAPTCSRRPCSRRPIRITRKKSGSCCATLG